MHSVHDVAQRSSVPFCHLVLMPHAHRFARPLALACTVLALAVAPMRAASAQVQDITVPVLPEFGAMTGISIPVGHLAEGTAPGFNVGALAQYRAPGEALGIRGELLYQHFPSKDSTFRSASSTALTLNVLYNVQGYDFRPYVIGGMGFYHLSQQGNHPGLNAGVGIDIPLTGLSAHIETRIHWALTSGPNNITIPFSFGLRF